jgi:hypothetical protein
MNCPSCGSEVQSGFAFCPKCGTKQPTSCPGCGHMCAPDFTYCPKCGAHVDAVPKAGIERPSPTIPAIVPMRARPPALTLNPAAETEQAFPPKPHKIDTEANRRTITVLFADLSGFTTMSERLDPEVMQTFQNELFEELTAGARSWRLRGQIHRRRAARAVWCAGRARRRP